MNLKKIPAMCRSCFSKTLSMSEIAQKIKSIEIKGNTKRGPKGILVSPEALKSESILTNLEEVKYILTVLTAKSDQTLNFFLKTQWPHKEIVKAKI